LRKLRKIANYRNHLRFNIRCLHNNLTPKSLHLSSPTKGHKANSTLRKAEKSLINERVRQTYFTLKILNDKAFDLKCTLPSDTYDRVISFIEQAQLSQHDISKKRQIEKFIHLKTYRKDKEDQPEGTQKDRWVKNLSYHQLNEHEFKVLSRGLNFAVTPKSLPVPEIITATESAIRLSQLNDSKASELRHSVSNILLQTKQLKDNISKQEQQAIKSLNNNRDIVIIPADKGRCTVVLNETDYDQKCNDL
jgi:hypothetical protein